jgi:hypothetical protein
MLSGGGIVAMIERQLGLLHLAGQPRKFLTDPLDRRVDGWPDSPVVAQARDGELIVAAMEHRVHGTVGRVPVGDEPEKRAQADVSRLVYVAAVWDPTFQR